MGSAMKEIESYTFGNIKINGKEYKNDVIVFPNRVKSNWWRKEGHNLHIEDLEEVIKRKPPFLVVGKGAYGRMRVRQAVKKDLKQKGIENIITLNTKQACEKFNELIQSGKEAVAALHLTC